MKQMIIANRLADGLVVFLGPDGAWTTAIADGRVLDADAADDALADAKRHEAGNVIVEPALIEVTVDADGVPRPTAVREAIRAFGPTVEEPVGLKNRSAAVRRG